MTDGGGERVAQHVQAVADELGLAVVKPFARGVFGAVLVRTAEGDELVLKVRPDPALEPVWATGAETAALLHDRGYPNPRILQLGSTDAAVWSLQERLPGEPLRKLTPGLAEQLIGLARRHATDSGRRRPWRDEAIAAARGWLDACSTDASTAGLLAAALDRGEGADLSETTIVHGDFHHGNALVDGDVVVGVIDWDLAGPGDWRFDLVMLAFGCRVSPESCDPAAAAMAAAAVGAECADEVAALMMACQVLRLTSMIAVGSPERAATACQRMVQALDPWLR